MVRGIQESKGVNRLFTLDLAHAQDTSLTSIYNEKTTMENQKSLFGRQIQSVVDAVYTIELGEEDEASMIAAWQYLIDTGHVWQMQGIYGRTAVYLLQEGICTAPDET